MSFEFQILRIHIGYIGEGRRFLEAALRKIKKDEEKQAAAEDKFYKSTFLRDPLSSGKRRDTCNSVF